MMIRNFVPSIHRCIVLLLLLSFPAMAAATEKSERLEKVMAEISMMNHQLSEREAEATDVRNQLIAQLTGIETETRREIRQAGLSGPPDVTENAKIFYNMKLIGELQGYIDSYAQKIEDYRLARSRLGYLYQYADDDLKIINTLSNMKIDSLVSQIQNTLASYASSARALMIHPETFQTTSTDNVWERLSAVK